jgi:hypothetical protein
MSTKPGDETMIDVRALARKSDALSDLSELARRAASTSPVGTQDIGQTVVIREPQPERLRRLTIELHEQANAIDDAFEAIHDERQALEDDSE